MCDRIDGDEVKIRWEQHFTKERKAVPSGQLTHSLCQHTDSEFALGECDIEEGNE